MTAALIALAGIALSLGAALGYLLLRSSLTPGPKLTKRTLVIHTRDDKAIRGVLYAQHADRYTLREAVYLYGSGEQEVGGIVHVPVANIAWCQEIEPKAG